MPDILGGNLDQYAGSSKGSNVKEFLKRQAELEILRDEMQEQKKLASFAHFEINALKKQASVRQARNQKLAEDEVASLNIEVRERRRACLRDLYSAEEEMQDKELRDLGMAFVKERL